MSPITLSVHMLTLPELPILPKTCPDLTDRARCPQARVLRPFPSTTSRSLHDDPEPQDASILAIFNNVGNLSSLIFSFQAERLQRFILQGQTHSAGLKQGRLPTQSFIGCFSRQFGMVV